MAFHTSALVCGAADACTLMYVGHRITLDLKQAGKRFLTKALAKYIPFGVQPRGAPALKLCLKPSQRAMASKLTKPGLTFLMPQVWNSDRRIMMARNK